MKSSNLTILQNLWKHAGLDLITLQIRFFNSLRGPGGLHQNFLEIDFLVVSDREE